MKCTEAQELFGIYFDLPEGDPRCKQVDEHLEHCDSCREEFEMWEESTDLIRLAKEEPEHYPSPRPAVTDQVMQRIYAKEAWRTPVSDRIYTIPYKLRRNLTGVIAFCLALFMVSFIFNAFGEEQTAMEEVTSHYGIKEPAKVSVSASDSLNVHKMTKATLASAAPTLLEPVKLGPIQTVPNYYLSLSLLGLICTMLIMNWLNRTRV